MHPVRSVSGRKSLKPGLQAKEKEEEIGVDQVEEEVDRKDEDEVVRRGRDWRRKRKKWMWTRRGKSRY